MRRKRKNVALLRKTMETVETIPEWDEVKDDPDLLLRAARSGQDLLVWNQWSWWAPLKTYEPQTGSLVSCGSSFCFAGHAAFIDGAAVITDGDFKGEVVLADGTMVSIQNYAMNALGLTNEEADELFAGDNSKEKLRRLVNEYIADAEREG